MTIIIRLDVVPTKRPGFYTRDRVVEKLSHNIKHQGRILHEIDYTETTASHPWVKITFADTKESFFELMDRLEVKK